MKKLLTALGLAALLAGCASHDNGMGGTSDQSDQDTMKTDSIHSTQNGGSQYNNNAVNGTGSDTAPNSATDTTPTTPPPQ